MPDRGNMPKRCADMTKAHRAWNAIAEAEGAIPEISAPPVMLNTPKSLKSAVDDAAPTVKMCQKHGQPAETCSGISCRQDRAARLARLGLDK